MCLINKQDNLSENKNSYWEIPYPHLQSYMHQRISIPKLTYQFIIERWKNSPSLFQKIEYFFSRIVKTIHLLDKRAKWGWYNVIFTAIRKWLKFYYHLETENWNRLPSQGAIIYLNHISELDVVLTFLSAFKKPVGIFTAIGDGLWADCAELLGIVPRRGNAPVMIEKMIKQILLRNRYFAIWPEGTGQEGEGIMEAFSSIVKVYATINCDKDRIPFLPILVEYEGGSPRHPPVRPLKGKAKHLVYRMLKPYFIPRSWLKKPEDGGKTAREISNFMMMKLAKSIGQNKLSKNRLLEARRKKPFESWN